MAAYYPDPSWPSRPAAWEQPQPPPRSGASSTVHQDGSTAFAAQFDEIERAADNLAKSGKPFAAFPMPGRRESMPMMVPRPFADFDPRMSGPAQRHHSISEYDGMRSHPATNVQSYYQTQRYAPRPSEVDPAAQNKRRMAAQRERELRNFHQEQQLHRNLSGRASNRSQSPQAVSDEDRLEALMRRNPALYDEPDLANGNGTKTNGNGMALGNGNGMALNSGNGMALGNGNGHAARRASGHANGYLAGRDPFARARDDGALDGATHDDRTGATPPAVAPIGTRPSVSAGKRPSPPVQSPLGGPGAAEADGGISLFPSSPALAKDAKPAWSASSSLWGPPRGAAKAPGSVWT